MKKHYVNVVAPPGEIIESLQETVTAEYFSVDPDTGWIEFKDDDHKIVYACPANRVRSVHL